MDRAEIHAELRHILNTAHPGSPLLSPKHPHYPWVQAALTKVQAHLSMGTPGVISQAELRPQAQDNPPKNCIVCGRLFYRRSDCCSERCRQKARRQNGEQT